jgi:hypothetical protein
MKRGSSKDKHSGVCYMGIAEEATIPVLAIPVLAALGQSLGRGQRPSGSPNQAEAQFIARDGHSKSQHRIPKGVR